MADVVVTGASGLLGAQVVELLKHEHDVTALSRSRRSSPGDVRWIIHDLAGPTLPADFPSCVDVVIHLAQSRQFRDFPSGAPDTFAVNVASTTRLLDWAIGANASQFILASTGGVYNAGSGPHQEDEPITLSGVPSFYAASKLAAEVMARSYGSRLAVCVLRPFFMYGRGQDASMLLPRLVERVRSGAAIVVDGRDGMRFNPVHVSDAAKAVVAALNLPLTSVVNVAGPEVLHLRQAVNLLAAHLGAEPNLEVRADSRPTDLIGDTTRMEALLVPPKTLLADVLGELCE